MCNDISFLQSLILILDFGTALTVKSFFFLHFIIYKNPILPDADLSPTEKPMKNTFPHDTFQCIGTFTNVEMLLDVRSMCIFVSLEIENTSCFQCVLLFLCYFVLS